MRDDFFTITELSKLLHVNPRRIVRFSEQYNAFPIITLGTMRLIRKRDFFAWYRALDVQGLLEETLLQAYPDNRSVYAAEAQWYKTQIENLYERNKAYGKQSRPQAREQGKACISQAFCR